MKTAVFFVFILLNLHFLVPQDAACQQITFQSLLKEMVNRDLLAEYPQIPYRSLQASSYNRESVSPDLPGWFADSDGVSCIRTERNGDREEWVLMEDFGPGCISKIWAVCFYYGLNDTIGGNVRIYLDGAVDPVVETNLFDLVKGVDFVKPPFADVSTRAGNLYLPIPYQRGCKITLDKKAFYYIINYRSYPEGTTVKTFSRQEYDQSRDVLTAVGKQLTEAVSFSDHPIQTSMLLSPGDSCTLKLPAGSHAIKRMRIYLESEAISQALRSTVLQATFDGQQTIWCPVGDFFNNGVKRAPYHMWERTVSPDGMMECRWVMPYQQTGQIVLNNLGDAPVKVTLEIQTDAWIWTPRSMHFHASWRMDEPVPTFPLFDWNLLEVRGKGVYVGDQFTVLNPAEGWWGEGDEKIYADDDLDSRFPSHFGTGTEDYYGWAGGVVPNPQDQFSNPFLANVLVGSPNAMGYNICSRTRVLDAIPFQEQFKFDMESSCGTRNSWFHLLYSATSFWYAVPGAVSNRSSLPEMAARPLMRLEELQQINEQAKSYRYVVENAIECENLHTYRIDSGVEEKTNLTIWGEVSNGALKVFQFDKPGATVSVRITEQFHPAQIQLCAIVGPDQGTFDIWVNGNLVLSPDLRSGHHGVTTPYLNLGTNKPQGNAFEIRFVYKGNPDEQHTLEKGATLGLDFFLLEQID